MWRKIILFSVLFILLTSISVTSASVSYFEISPENPVKGDIVEIEGKASPSEQVPIKLSFEEDLNVVKGKYEWELSSVEIPKGENRFTVTATNVNNLNVALKIFFRDYKKCGCREWNRENKSIQCSRRDSRCENIRQIRLK